MHADVQLKHVAERLVRHTARTRLQRSSSSSKTTHMNAPFD
jgi:hypothetical protein